MNPFESSRPITINPKYKLGLNLNLVIEDKDFERHILPMLKGIFRLTRAEALVFGYFYKNIDLDTVYFNCEDFFVYCSLRKIEMSIPTIYRAVTGLIDKEFISKRMEKDYYFINKTKFNHAKD